MTWPWCKWVPHVPLPHAIIARVRGAFARPLRNAMSIITVVMPSCPDRADFVHDINPGSSRDPHSLSAAMNAGFGTRIYAMTGRERYHLRFELLPETCVRFSVVGRRVHHDFGKTRDVSFIIVKLGSFRDKIVDIFKKSPDAGFPDSIRICCHCNISVVVWLVEFQMVAVACLRGVLKRNVMQPIVVGRRKFHYFHFRHMTVL